MKFYIDSEFFEDGSRINLISLAIVAEDGRELYIEDLGFSWYGVPVAHWTQTNVKPHLRSQKIPVDMRKGWLVEQKMADGRVGQNTLSQGPPHERRLLAHVISEMVASADPIFYGYFSDYDWVGMCQIFGDMASLPKGFPMYCRDLKQMMDERELGDAFITATCQYEGVHNALDDARWNKRLHEAIIAFDQMLAPAPSAPPAVTPQVVP